MRRLRIGLNVLLLGLLLSGTVLASDVSHATNKGVITVVNAGAAASNVAAVFPLTSSEWIGNGYFSSDYSNVAIQAGSGADAAFMPGATTWCMYAGSPGASSSTAFYFYTGGATGMGGKLRCFPTSDGLTAADAASLEPGNNFEVSLAGYFDPGVSGNLVKKPSALTVSCGAGDIVAAIQGPPDRSTNITPGTTGSWTDVDVSTYVPESATGVIVELSGTGSAYMSLRPNGSSDNLTSGKYTGHAVGYVGIDGDGIFEAYISSGSSLYLLGYVDDSWTFLPSAENLSLSVVGVDTDITVNHTGATAAIIDIVNTGASSYTYRVRENGTSCGSNKDIIAGSHTYAIVTLDASRVFEMLIENVAVDCYLVGYITDGIDGVGNSSIDKSLSSTGTWTDIDCSADAPGATSLIFEVYSAASSYEDEWDMRGDGDTTEHYNDNAVLHWYILVPCSATGVCEGKIGRLPIDWFLVSYCTSGIEWLNSAIEVTASGVSSGEHDVKVTADGTNLKIYVDDVLKDTTALSGASVADVSQGWQYGTGGSCLYLESLETKVGGVTKQAVDFSIPPGAGGLYEDSVGDNDITASLRTTASDPDVTASVTSFEPVAPAEAEYVSNGEAGDMLSGAPAEPAEMYQELEVDHLPGAALVNVLLDAGEIPRALFWFPFAFTLSLALALLVYYLSRSLLATSIAMGVALAFMSKCGILPFFVVIPFVLIAVGVLVKEKTVSF